MLRSSLAGLFAVASLAATACAAVIEYDWDITWVNAAPDGTGRAVIGVNGAWPCPEIRATKGDTIKVKIKNSLGNQTTGLHFHGINQISTNWMDGPSMVTQCPVPPGESMTYQFEADAAGTYWWHSHNLGQYPDGLRGPLIVDDPDDPYKDSYDEEYTLMMSDWYHEDSITLVKRFLNAANPQGIPPIPKGMLLNDGQGADYKFEKGKKYRFRMINVAALASFMVHFDSHDMHVIMNDGAYVKKDAVYQLRVAPAQRFDVIIECIQRDNRNYPFLVGLDINTDWTSSAVPLRWPFNATGYLVMDEQGERRPHVVTKWRPHEDSHLLPLDDAPGVLPDPDKIFQFDFESGPDKFGIHRAFVNGSPYVNPKVPTLYTAATTGEFNTKPAVYGAVHPFIVSNGDIVDIVVNNHDSAVHPFHLHGHHFQVLKRPGSNTGNWPGVARTQGRYATRPPSRDTVVVMANSYAVLRFEANNPGVYLFHCHIEWHVEMGLTATIIEAPELLRDIPIPEDHIEVCKKAGMGYEGNAGGAVEDPLDTSNIDYDAPEHYHGSIWTPPALRRTRRSRIARQSHW